MVIQPATNATPCHVIRKIRRVLAEENKQRPNVAPSSNSDCLQAAVRRWCGAVVWALGSRVSLCARGRPVSAEKSGSYRVLFHSVYTNKQVTNKSVSQCVFPTLVLKVARTFQDPGPFPPGGGGTQENFIRGDPAPRSNPLPFYISFFIEKEPLSSTFHRKWYPFHIASIENGTPFI